MNKDDPTELPEISFGSRNGELLSFELYLGAHCRSLSILSALPPTTAKIVARFPAYLDAANDLAQEALKMQEDGTSRGDPKL